MICRSKVLVFENFECEIKFNIDARFRKIDNATRREQI